MSKSQGPEPANSDEEFGESATVLLSEFNALGDMCNDLLDNM